jgi:hypothetical protein
MSLAAWYLHKADQCARLAKDATEPRKRSDFETERKLWLQIIWGELLANYQERRFDLPQNAASVLSRNCSERPTD